jgi:hypothetical protein
MIYKLFTGRHIDLSKLVSVSEIVRNDYIGYEAKQFTLIFQLLERPIVIRMMGSAIIREASPDHWIADYDGKNETFIEQERDKILNDWQAFKNNLNLEI